MSISLSDIIWTIICFSLFMLILNGLIIKPVIKLMDARRSKVENARSRKAERETAKARAFSRALADSAERERLAEEKTKLALAEAEEAAREELRALEASLRSEEEEVLARLDKEATAADARFEEAMDRMAEAFTEKLTKGGEG